MAAMQMLGRLVALVGVVTAVLAAAEGRWGVAALKLVVGVGFGGAMGWIGGDTFPREPMHLGWRRRFITEVRAFAGLGALAALVLALPRLLALNWPASLLIPAGVAGIGTARLVRRRGAGTLEAGGIGLVTTVAAAGAGLYSDAPGGAVGLLALLAVLGYAGAYPASRPGAVAALIRRMRTKPTPAPAAVVAVVNDFADALDAQRPDRVELLEQKAIADGGRASRRRSEVVLAIRPDLLDAPDEVRGHVLAHELGHIDLGHLTRTSFLVQHGIGIAMALLALTITVSTVVTGQLAWWVFFLLGTVLVGGMALAGLDSRAQERSADAFAARHGYPLTPARLEWSGIEVRPTSAWLRLIATHPTWEQRLAAAANSKVAVSPDADAVPTERTGSPLLVPPGRTSLPRSAPTQPAKDSSASLWPFPHSTPPRNS